MRVTIVSAILILFASALFLNVNAQPRRQFCPKQGAMMQKLNLTEDQQNKIEDLRTKHQKEMIDLRADLQKKELTLRELRSKDDVSRDDIVNAVKNVNSSRNEMAVARANHRYDVYETLTADQKKIWKDNFGQCCGKGNGKGLGMGPGAGKRMRGLQN